MSRFLFALGQSSFRHRWWVLGAWLAVLIAVVVGFLGFRGQPSDNFTIPGTESQRAVEQLQQNLPAFSGAQTQLTFVAPEGRAITDPSLTPAINEAVAAANNVENVAAAAGPSQTGQSCRRASRRFQMMAFLGAGASSSGFTTVSVGWTSRIANKSVMQVACAHARAYDPPSVAGFRSVISDVQRSTADFHPQGGH